MGQDSEEFTFRAFTPALWCQNIRRRFGAVGRPNSIALVQRLWRSHRGEYAGGLFLYRSLRSIEADKQRYAEWFNGGRPHQRLGGRTPDEVHAERPRRPRLPPARAVLRDRYLGDDRGLPLLRLRRAA